MSNAAHHIEPFDNYEISGCKAYDEDNGRDKYFEPVDDSEADIWTLYGHTEGEGVSAIGDFTTREAAEWAYVKIVGEPFKGNYEANPILRVRNSGPELLRLLERSIGSWKSPHEFEGWKQKARA